MAQRFSRPEAQKRPPRELAPKVEARTRDRVPRDPSTGDALPPCSQPGYYPGFSTLAQQNFWDEATRKIILKRVYEVPPIRFFTADEAQTLKAILDRIIPQDDRDEEHRIPILNYIDQRIYEKKFDGYIFEGLPSEEVSQRLGIQAINQMARQRFARGFADLEMKEQDEILLSIRDGRPEGAEEFWRNMPPKNYWTLLVQDAVAAYYAHPYAWDEIGFGGPSYPRGYMRLSNGLPEPWEMDEQRYEWLPPEGSLSDTYRPLEGLVSSGHHGQTGTH